METSIKRDSGSFKDPAGYVFIANDHVIRTVNPIASNSFQEILKTGLIDLLIEKGLVIPTEIDQTYVNSNLSDISPRGETPSFVLKHPKIPFISYPYEWTFEQLQDAALTHLNIQIAALEHNVVLSDASPFNMQFFENRILHIDVLSFKPYIDDEPWGSYNQFCKHFILPLLIEAWAGIPFQPMLRGKIDGLNFADTISILPKHRLWSSLNGILHVAFQSMLLSKTNSSSTTTASKRRYLSKTKHLAMLSELHVWIKKLRSGRKALTYWNDYAIINSYSDGMRETKEKFIENWASLYLKNGTIWDIGGNTGDYSEIALKAGVKSSIVLDSDLDSLKKTYEKSKNGLNILPVVMDIADPSPQLGWNQKERAGLNERTKPDGVIALAVIHHLAIGRNIPLQDIIQWIVGIAPSGVIEFVPKTDPMVQEMLSEREDVFLDYDESHFFAYLQKIVKLTNQYKFIENNRVIVSYQRLS